MGVNVLVIGVIAILMALRLQAFFIRNFAYTMPESGVGIRLAVDSVCEVVVCIARI